ncbi:MAG: hypothetical protein GWP10_01870 [Nitrospiraceae bacterium]|nr:hypothetical protein [Nitrospiraceae bacterium]
MVRRKKGEKKRLKRLRQQSIKKLRDLIGRDDQAFIKAHIRLYPKIEISPYRETFYKAVYREAVKTLSAGHWKEAKDIAGSLPTPHPLILLIDAVSLLSKGRAKEAHVCLEDLAKMDGAGDFLPLIADLNGLTENPDSDRLNVAIKRTIQGQNPRPRMSTQLSKDVWRLFRLLHRPEKDGYSLPHTYWRDLGRCISDIKARGIHTRFLDQAERIVQIQKDMVPCLSADVDKIERMLDCWADDIRSIVIGRGDPPLPKSLEHLAQCVRLTCYRILTRSEDTVLWKGFGDILIGLLDVSEAEYRELKKAMDRWSIWTSMVKERDLDGIGHMLLQHRNNGASTAQECFLTDIALYSLAVHKGPDEEDLFSGLMGDEDPSAERALDLDALEDAAATIADLPDRCRREAAQVIQTELNEMEGISANQIRRQGEIWLTLSEYFPKDGSLLLVAYAALRLSNSLNVLARRTKKTLITKGNSLNYNKLQPSLSGLFYSTIDTRYSKAWKEIFALCMELVPRQRHEIEQNLASKVLKKWIDINKVAVSPLADLFSQFSDLDMNREMAGEIKEFTDRILQFGRGVLGDNPEILALEILSILVNIPKKKRLSSLNQRFNKTTLPVKWRVAVYLGTIDMAGIKESSRLILAYHALSRILPAIPHDFGHWEEIVSCVDDMGESVPRGQSRQYRSLRQLLLKKLKDVRTKWHSTEKQAVITEYIDRMG